MEFGLLGFVLGLVLGYVLRPITRRSARPIDASAGVAVLMRGDQILSRRRLHRPTATIPRYHGRGAVEMYVYTGRNNANELVYRKADE